VRTLFHFPALSRLLLGFVLVLAWSAAEATDAPKMVRFEPGSFRIGTETGEPDERPVRQVQIRMPFALAVTEVTRGQYAAFVAATKRHTQAGCRVYVDGKLTVNDEASWQNPGFDQTDDHPVVCVSWDNATAYATWLSTETQRAFRLPTEAEWEYVARKASSTETFWSAPEEACTIANGTDETALTASGGQLVTGDPKRYTAREQYVFPCFDKAVYTSAVGQLAPDRNGLHDFMGNAWEFIQDCVTDSYQSGPTDERAVISGDCTRRGLRGGAWNTGPLYVRIGNRSALAQQDRNWAIGFRLAETLGPAPQQ
jgi:formylglycine-generating enzyme